MPPKRTKMACGVALEARAKIDKHELECAEAYRKFRSEVENFKTTLGQTLIKMEEVDTTMLAVKKALLGDEFKEHPGVIERLADLEKAVHGQDGEPGLFIRRDQLLRYAFFTLALSAIAGGGLGGTGAALLKLVFGG